MIHGKYVFFWHIFNDEPCNVSKGSDHVLSSYFVSTFIFVILASTKSYACMDVHLFLWFVKQVVRGLLKAVLWDGDSILITGKASGSNMSSLFFLSFQPWHHSTRHPFVHVVHTSHFTLPSYSTCCPFQTFVKSSQNSTFYCRVNRTPQLDYMNCLFQTFVKRPQNSSFHCDTENLDYMTTLAFNFHMGFICLCYFSLAVLCIRIYCEIRTLQVIMNMSMNPCSLKGQMTVVPFTNNKSWKFGTFEYSFHS